MPHDTLKLKSGAVCQQSPSKKENNRNIWMNKRENERVNKHENGIRSNRKVGVGKQ